MFRFSLIAFIGLSSHLFAQSNEGLHCNYNLECSLENMLLDCNPQEKQGRPHAAHQNVDFSVELSAEAEPLVTVAGCVNVVSGHLFLIEKDILGNTIDPLPFIRYYDSGSKAQSMLGYGYGSQFPLWASDLFRGSRHHYAALSEREGSWAYYQTKHGNAVFSIDPRVLEKGYTNLNRHKKSNFINRRAKFIESPNRDESYWKVSFGDGSRHFYRYLIRLGEKDQRKLGLLKEKNYLLSREVKANGNELQFSYSVLKGIPKLKEIRTLSRNGSTVLNSLSFNYDKDHCTVTSSSGDSVQYSYHTACDKINQLKGEKKEHLIPEVIQYALLKGVSSSQQGHISYETRRGPPNEDLNWKVVNVNKPEGRFLSIKYQKDQKYGERVHTLLEPLNWEGTPCPSYQLTYADDHTMVFDALDQPILYHFDKNKRLIQRDYLSGGHSVMHDLRDFAHRRHLFKQELFEWSRKEGEEGWLKAKTVGLGKALYHRKSYHYDSRGNVTEETIYGNITGERGETFENKWHTDRYRTTYAYSQEGRNLLKEKKTPEGWIIRYDYLPGTNLPTRILHLYDGKIQQREFFEYDDNGQLKLAIEDDARGEIEEDLTDHTYRKMKFIEACVTSGPSFGKPQVVTEGYRENRTGEFIPLKRTVYSYDDRGNEIEQTLFVNEQFCYQTKKSYDQRRRVIEETNAVGETTRFAYDDNDNKIEEELVGSGKVIRYVYDKMNRLITKSEYHNNGWVANTVYHYNLLGQLMAEEDPYRQPSYFSYDRFGNQTKEVKPFIQTEEGQIVYPTIEKTYNLLGQMTSLTDENGFTTSYSYNIYGSPTTITYPDQSTERFVYYPNGQLKQKWLCDGTSIRYRYDGRGHLLEEETLDQAENRLKVETYTYKGSLLLSKTDAMGFVTLYDYDCAGRKIVEDFHHGARKTTYAYDGLDRVISKTTVGEQPLTETYQYDGLNRLVRKCRVDQQGNIYGEEFYRYDAFGNRIEKEIPQTESQSAHYTSSYHSDGTLAWQKDPLDHMTHWHYSHDHRNGIGQIVQSRARFDALGRLIQEADDAHGRLARRDVICNDIPYAISHYFYDPKGLKSQEQTTVTNQGAPLREYVVRWTYHCRGWKASETELPSGKQTRFDYDTCGRLIRRIKPDGVSLHYAYNGLGHLIAKSSSDGTVHYTYEVDLNGNPIKIHDHVRNRTHLRKYDPLNRLIEEENAPGCVIRYSYDPHDRLTSLTLPDGSLIGYHYVGGHLKAVNRLSADGQHAYSCSCSDYDRRGHLLKLTNPAGAINHRYDLLGRLIHVDANQWSTSLEQFDGVGNLLKMKTSDPIDEWTSHFSYDRFDQLTSERGHVSNDFTYDSLGNCLKKNELDHLVNDLNQFQGDGRTVYKYDLNGNLSSEIDFFNTIYRYDALNRLTEIERKGDKITFVYDAFDRCIEINDSKGKRTLFYQGDKEIGSLFRGQVDELRIAHPMPSQELTFALELNQEVFYPVQDCRYQPTVLFRKDGAIAQYYRYASFGLQSTHGSHCLTNPWLFANRRAIAGLSLFTHRFYHSSIRRWITTDPLGFEDGLNLYAYVHNNPFRYTDPDGRFVFMLPLLSAAFGTAEVTLILLPAVKAAIATAVITYASYKVAEYINDNSKIISNDDDEDHWDQVGDNMKNQKGPKGSTKVGQGNTTERNDVQNRQAKDARREIERDIGRRLTQKERREFHDEVTKKGYGYHELVEEGGQIFHD